MSDQHPIECHFFDVGQASCNIILLGGRRGIVIDIPASKSGPLRFLREHVDILEAVIITHNDADHVNGLGALYGEYRSEMGGTIGSLFFLTDRELDQTDPLQLALKDHEAGTIGNLGRLERTDDNRPKVLWEDPESDIRLEAIYPSFLANLGAPVPNETSGIILLRYGESRILYTGDAPTNAWNTVTALCGGNIRCDTSTVPHHGGSSGRQRSGAHTYANTVTCAYGIISVGTSNTYEHPYPSVVSELRESGTTVMCTQITAECVDCLEDWRTRLRRPSRYCRSSLKEERTGAGRSANVPCAATVVAQVTPEDITIENIDTHQNAVDRLTASAEGKPLCR
jgi:competence protein ComEC